MFFRTPAFLPYLYPTLLWRMPPGPREIYLTFDDGPIPGPTEFVLDTLTSMGNIPATFFCIGDNVRKHPLVFRRILEQGHAVGNHTDHHVNGWKCPTTQYLQEVATCDQRLPETRLFRPPYGRISRKQISNLGHRTIVMWDVLTHDYNNALSPSHCLAGTLKAVRPGSIVVFHDSLKAARNMETVLPAFITECLNRGYVFRSLQM
ncbi:MAG: polysaccharide deacetylase family protein [Cyclobacteriaceae bacterium]|nr:polysaccharide deacetylase family protein [Cyclobacteriaceae bacterium]